MKFNQYRKLGRFGADVAPIGLGAMSFTNFYGSCDDNQAHDVLTAALDLDLKHIDTSNVYGAGKSEDRIGKFLSKEELSLKEMLRVKNHNAKIKKHLKYFFIKFYLRFFKNNAN